MRQTRFAGFSRHKEAIIGQKSIIWLGCWFGQTCLTARSPIELDLLLLSIDRDDGLEIPPRGQLTNRLPPLSHGPTPGYVGNFPVDTVVQQPILRPPKLPTA